MNKRELRKLLCSMLLGDGCLSPINRKSVGNTSRFTIRHSANQEDYALWKAELINSIFIKKNLPRRCTYVRGRYLDKRTEKYYSTIAVNLNWSDYFRHLRKRTHKFINGKDLKNVSYLLSQIDSGLHLAIWMGDDATEYRPKHKKVPGEFYKPKIMLATDSFTEGQNNLIKKWFEAKYKISPTVYKHGNYYRLYFPVTETEKLFKLIHPHLENISSMRQKFWLCYKMYSTDKSKPQEMGEDIVQSIND